MTDRRFFVALLWLPFLSFCRCFSAIAPELSRSCVGEVNAVLTDILASVSGDAANRYASARTLAKMSGRTGTQLPQHELVYGELSVPVLATLLDAVGVCEGDSFLDIGSGDGALVLGAAMLFPQHLHVSRGLEIVPGLWERSQRHLELVQPKLSVPVEFLLGDVHSTQNSNFAGTTTSIPELLNDSTLGVCFATTWSAGNSGPSQRSSLQRRALPKLSSALSRMPKGARVVVVDGRLDCNDGYQWQGDLKIQCPDTAPFSVAALYQRI